METLRRIFDDPTGEKRLWFIGLASHAVVYTIVCTVVLTILLSCGIGALVIARLILNWIG